MLDGEPLRLAADHFLERRDQADERAALAAGDVDQLSRRSLAGGGERFARTTSETWTKSRVCRPSPKTMGCVPSSRRVAQRGLGGGSSRSAVCRRPWIV